MSDFLTPVAKAFTNVLSPLRLSFSSKEELEIFLARYGWDAQVNGGEMNAINGAFALEGLLNEVLLKLDLLINGVGSASMGAAGELLAEIKNTITRLNGLSTTGGSGMSFPFDQSSFWNELTGQVVEDLVVTYFEKHQPLLFGLLHFTGIIGFDKITPPQGSQGRIPYIRPHIHWDLLPRSFATPGDVLNDLYKWNIPGQAFQHEKFLRTLERVFLAFGLPVYFGPPRESLATAYLTTANILPQRLNELEVCFIEGISPSDNAYWKIGLVLLPIPDPTGSAGAPRGILVLPLLQGELNLTSYFTQSIGFSISGAVDSSDSIIASIYPDKASISANASQTEFNFSFTLTGKPDQPWILIGTKGSSRLELDGFTAQFGIRGTVNESEIYFGLGTGENSKIRLIVETKNSDGFLKKILGEEGFNAEVGIGIRWSSKRGLSFDGSLAFDFSIPINRAIGPITIETIYIGAVAGTRGLDLNLGVGIKGELGPMIAVVKNIGLRTSLVPTNQQPGVFGNLDLEFGIKPPSGAGFSLDIAAVKLGGFLFIDEPKGEYFGTLEIEIKPISLGITAIGLLNTKMLDGDGGFSLLIILTAEFMPIQLGFGFTLVGLGGLFGYNRTMDTDYLRAGLHQGTLKNILFPEDVVANINTIVKDIKGVFPIKRDHFVVGPMAKIGWGSPPLITAELGVIIEFPGPSRTAIAGIIRAKLPTEKAPILVLQIHFLGILDFEKKLISLDASLIDSKVLAMTLSGDFALRLGWGSPGMFILSSGGFHPDFKDAPPDLQNLKRLGITVIDKENVKIWADSYFAITSNTVQFGAHAHLWATGFGYTATAEVGMDALIQFNPFWFTFSMYISGRVTGGILMDAISIEVSGSLSGPNPWHASGGAKACVVIEVEIALDATWGETVPEVVQESENVLRLLIEEVGKMTNWKAVAGGKATGKISMRSPDSNAKQPVEMVVHPDSILEFSQRLVPLETEIQKFGKKLVEGEKWFGITGVTFGNPQASVTAILGQDKLEAFVPGNFMEIQPEEGSPEQVAAGILSMLGISSVSNLNTAAQLAYPSFVEFKSGKVIRMAGLDANAEAKSAPTKKRVDYDLIYVRNEFREAAGSAKLSGDAFAQLAAGGAAAKSSLSNERNQALPLAPLQIVKQKPAYQVISATDGGFLSPAPHSNHVEAFAAHRKMDLAEQQNSLVVSTFEL